MLPEMPSSYGGPNIRLHFAADIPSEDPRTPLRHAPVDSLLARPRETTTIGVPCGLAKERLQSSVVGGGRCPSGGMFGEMQSDDCGEAAAGSPRSKAEGRSIPEEGHRPPPPVSA